MKIRQSSKARAAAQPRFRITYERDHDHEAWLTEGPAPTPGTVPDAFYRVYTPVELSAHKTPTRKDPHETLSIGALRRRLHRAGVRSSRIASMAREIHAGPGPHAVPPKGGAMVMQWPVKELERRFGRKVAKAVCRFVRIKFLMLDEFWGLAASQPLNDFVSLVMRRARRYNAEPVAVTEEAA